MQKFKLALQLCLILSLTAICGSANASEITAFGPKQYVRTTGAPNIYNDTFTAQPGEAQLVIRNGLPGEKLKKDKRIRSGVVSLNGTVLFTHDDFKHQTHILETIITLQESNDLRIELESIPTHYLSIEIIQEMPDPVYDIHAPDLQADTASCPDFIELKATIASVGEDEIAAGLPVSFYNGPPGEGGVLIGTTPSTAPLLATKTAEITYKWLNPGVEQATIYAVADDDGSGVGIYEETDENNNLVSLETFLCPVIPSGESSITGQVIDAVTGEFLSTTQIILHLDNNGSPGATVASTETDLDGKFLFQGLVEGSYIITASPEGYIAEQKSVSLAANTDLTNQDLALSPILADDEIRIILTWNDKPADMEAHLTSPNPDGCRFHCYYWNKNIPDANLDLDDRDGYGPETITITNKGPGIYRYYVHDFTNRYSANSGWLSLSRAEVKVYSGNKPPIVFNVTPYRYGNVWHVFNIDGDTGEVIPIDIMAHQREPGRIDYPTIISRPSRYADWNTPYTYQVQVTDPDNDTHTYELLRAPEGMTIDPATGLISWTPAGSQSGWYSVEVRVDDGRCGEATQAFSVYVNSQPTIQFTVDPCSGVNPGGEITLTWSTTRATTILIDQGIGEVPANGSLTIPSPAEPTLYTITAFNDAALSKRSVPSYPSATFYFSPKYIDPGESTTLYWTPYCSASADIDHNIGAVSASETGSTVVTPAATTTYYMNVSNASRTSRYGATVLVRTPPPPPVPSGVISVSSLSSPAPRCNITPGEPVTLTWWTSNATTVSISPDIGEVEPSGSITVYPTEAKTYTLTMTGDGGTTKRSVTFPNYPSLSFYSSAYGIDLGDTVTLRWASSCADTVTMDQGVGELAASGSMTVTPESLPITYYVRATNEGGTATRYVRLYQIAPNGSISTNPTVLKVGDSTTLTWSSTRADTCSITPDFGEVPCNGTTTVTPIKPTSYKFTMVGAGGTTSRYAGVNFVPPMADLNASTLSITEGEIVKLTWIYANTDSCSIDQEIGDIELGGERTVAPTTTTTYRMTAKGPGGTAYDTVTINVAPSTTPPPTVSLLASQTAIIRGGSTDLTWQSTGATSFTIEPDIGAVATSGTATVTPQKTTTYTATATGPSGTSVARVTVTVVQPAPSLTLQADKTAILEGSSAVLSWTSDFADRVILDPGFGDMDLQGSVTVTPTMTSTYKATAVGLGGTVTRNVTVTITYPLPVASITATPETIDLGASTTLTWTTANAETVSINPDIGSVPVSGSVSVSPTEDTTYTISAVGPGDTVTEQVTVTVTLPPPILSLTATPPEITAGGSSVLNWESQYADQCSLEPGVGPVSCVGDIVVTPSQTTTYTLTATGPGGTTSTDITVSKQALIISFDSPVAGDIINRLDTLVQGTIVSDQGGEIGVTVNGVIAQIDGSRFVANHVPLQIGDNTLTALAVDASGNTMQKAVNVVAKEPSRSITVEATLKSGLAPLTTQLQVKAHNFTLTGDWTVSASGPTSDIDYIATGELETMDATINTPGVYVFTIETQDELGNTYSDSVAVQAFDRGQLDALLQGKWTGMAAAFAAQNVEGGLIHLLDISRDRYREALNLIMADLPQLFSNLSGLEMIYVKNDRAKYRVHCQHDINGTPITYTYYIYFLKNTEGRWQIEQF